MGEPDRGDLGPDVPLPGEVIADKYEVIQVLATGGMGVVVEARHKQLRQRVAVKFLLPRAAQHAEFAERFLREARASVELRGEHVVRVIDVGSMPSGAPYMVMEHLQGNDLREELVRRGGLPISDAVDYVLQACEAIAEAHSKGIVHRDIKPSNLFLSPRPDGSRQIKVLDFGISKVTMGELGEENHTLTATATVLGSPQYMSPEQVRSSKTVDKRTDLWALGVTLHELIADDVPFKADTVPALSAAIVADPPIPLRKHRLDAPAELEAVVLRCLEKDPGKRYPSVAELVQELSQFASEAGRVHVQRAVRISLGSLSDADSGSDRRIPIRDEISNAATMAAIDSSSGVRAQHAVSAPSAVRTDVGVGTLAATSSTARRARGARRVGVGLIALGVGGAAALGLAVWLLASSTAPGPEAARGVAATGTPPGDAPVKSAAAAQEPQVVPSPVAIEAPPVARAAGSAVPVVKAPAAARGTPAKAAPAIAKPAPGPKPAAPGVDPLADRK